MDKDTDSTYYNTQKWLTSLHKTAILYFDKIILLAFLECVLRNSKSHQAILYHSLRSQKPIFPSIFESHISSAHRKHISESILLLPITLAW